LYITALTTIITCYTCNSDMAVCLSLENRVWQP